MASSSERDKALAAVQSIFDQFNLLSEKLEYNGFDRQLMRECRLIDAGPEGRVVFELDITDTYSNLNNVMHGGAAGLIFDMCTTTALGPVAKPGYWDFLGGVTRSLYISYLKAIPIGETIRINSHVVQHGRTMAMIRGEMASKDGKTTYTTCDHHKVNVATHESHMAAKAAAEAEGKQGTKAKL